LEFTTALTGCSQAGFPLHFEICAGQLGHDICENPENITQGVFASSSRHGVGMHQKKDAAHLEACEAPQQLMKSAQGMNSARPGEG